MSIDLSDLSEEELREIARDAETSLSEMEERTAFLRYEPMPYQRAWHESQANIVLVLAANQTGKTEGGAIEAIRDLTGVDPISLGGQAIDEYPVGNRQGWRVLIAGDSLDRSVRNTLIPKFKKYVTPDMLSEPPRIHLGLEIEWRFKSGATAIFGSYEQPKRVFEGPQWNRVWFDEPPPQHIFTACMRGTMRSAGRILITATPLNEPYLWDDIYIPSLLPESDLYGRVAYFRVDMESNCRECHGGYLPHAEIAAFLATLPEQERAARAHGQFMAFQGITFHYVKEETHVVPDFDVPAEWPIVEVLDPSMKRGLYVAWFCCSPKDEWVWFKAAKVPDGSFGLMAKEIRRHRTSIGREPDVAIMDARGGQYIIDKNSQHTWFQAFRRHPHRLYYEPSIDTPWQTLHDWMECKWKPEEEEHRPRLRMTLSVASMERGPMWAFERFRWDPLASRRAQYEQAPKDWMDCARYLTGFPGLTWQRLARSEAVRLARKTGPDLALTYSRRRAPGQMSLKSILNRKQKGLADWMSRIPHGYS